MSRLTRASVAVRTALIAVGLLVAVTPAGAYATYGKISVTSGGIRSATDTSSGYANALGGVAFQRGPRGATNPDTLTGGDWVALCTTDGTGSCTSASLEYGEYLVRESPTGAPAGWRSFTQQSWGGGSSGSSPARGYVGRVNVVSGTTAVHPSTTYAPVAANSSSGPFLLANDNPPLPGSCGLDVLMLLDRSGSIGNEAGEAAQYEAAAKGFVSALAGTPTRLKIFSFADSASANQNSFLDLSTPAGATSANSVIGSIYSSPAGGTNWDEGLDLASGAGVDVVVMITDGNPTVWAAGSTSSTVDVLDLTAGIASANKVKAIGKSASAGAKILAVGVGSGVTAANLSAISGPVAGTDWFTSGLAELNAMLQDIANQLCGSRVHVRKLTDEGDTTAAKSGWTMTAGKPAGSPVTFSPASLVTNGVDAHDTIVVDDVPQGGATGITITETTQGPYSFVASQCQKGSFPAAASGGTTTQTIATLGRNEDWYCTFRNKRNRPSISTTATTSATIGQSISDTASLTGLVGPSGTRSITFNAYGPDNATCSGTAAFTSTVAVTGNGSYDSGTFTPSTPGVYRWIAAYSGDVNNLAVSGACNDAGETSTVNKAHPSIATDASDGVVIGDAISDTATLSGEYNPTGGTVTFKLYGPNDATCSGSVLFTSTVGVSPGGTAVSGSFTPTAVGTYRWRASYSGDANNDAVALAACNAANENVVVSAKKPAISTSAVDGLLGGSIKDTATISGLVNPAGTRSVTFRAYGPANGDCSGTAAFTSTVPVTGNGSYDSAAFTPTAPGVYRWIASYSGDDNNLAVSGACNDTGESSTVGRLIVIVKVVNDNGGTKVPGDFTVGVTDPGTDPPSFAGEDTPGTDVPVDPGVYSVTETPLPGYSTEYGSDCKDTTLALGQTKTCTIINRDTPPRLTVIKQVVGGGEPSDFTMNVSGTDVSDPSFPGASGEGTTVTMDAGSYAVSESGDLGAWVSTTSADCEGALALGEAKTCTITNTRKATVTVKLVTDPAGAAQQFGFSSLAGSGAFSLGDGGSKSLEVPAGTYPAVMDDPKPLGWKLVALGCTETGAVDSSSSVATRSASMVAGPGEHVTCTFTVRQVVSQTVVVKAGDVLAYHGDTVTYSFSVTAGGNSPLHQVVVSDDKCPNVTGPVSKSNDDGDSVLDPVGVNGTSSEVWVYTCSYVLGAHNSGEANPVVNTATVNALDEYDRSVSDTDTHSTVVRHQAISIDKIGPATANQGDAVDYGLAVKNTGDTSFAEGLVIVKDPLCQAPPILVNKGGDASPATLDPGETWAYACTVSDTAGKSQITNVATVDGTDTNGRKASASDTQVTLLAAQAVLPETVISGKAKLRGPTGCLKNTGTAIITGRQIKSVTFSLDGKKVKKVTRADKKGRWLVKVSPTRLRSGKHTVTAKIVFVSASATKSRTLKLSFQKCQVKVLPAFTG